MAIEIRRVYTVPDTRTRGELKPVLVVEFMVDGQGPLLVEVPGQDPEAQVVRARIEQEAALVRSLLSGW